MAVTRGGMKKDSYDSGRISFVFSGKSERRSDATGLKREGRKSHKLSKRSPSLANRKGVSFLFHSGTI